MTSILDVEVASVYGALDSDVFGDGDLPDAEVTRRMVIGANRLLFRADEPLINLIYDSGGAVTETPPGALLGFGPPTWIQIIPGPLHRPKKPGLTRSKLFVRAYARNGEKIYLQIHTRAAPANPNGRAGDVNVLELVGTGNWEDYTLDDIPIDYGVNESITAFLRGLITATTASTGTYGSPNTGTVTGFNGSRQMQYAGATWNLGGNTLANGGHAVTFEDASGRPLASPQWIVGMLPEPVVPPTYADRLLLHPGIPNEFVRTALVGATFRIFETPRWRIANIALYPKDRVP